MAKIDDIKIKIDASELTSFVKIVCSRLECAHNEKLNCNLKKIHIDRSGGCYESTTEE